MIENCRKIKSAILSSLLEPILLPIFKLLLSQYYFSIDNWHWKSGESLSDRINAKSQMSINLSEEDETHVNNKDTKNGTLLYNCKLINYVLKALFYT